MLSQLPIGAAGPYQFTYDPSGSGELTSIVFPYGGEISWNYETFSYIGNRSLREVSARYLAPDSLHATNPPWTYGISRPDAANSVTVHSAMTLTDASGVGAKTWNFVTSGSPWQIGLISQFVQSASANGTVLQSDTYTWSQDPVGRPYISAKSTATGQGTSNPQTAYSTQTLDRYGNVTQSVIYPYNNSSTPLQTYANTYLSSSNYTSNYIFNLLSTTTLNTGAGPFTIQSNQYDAYSCATANDGVQLCGYVESPTTYTPPAREFDASSPIPAGSQGAQVTSMGVRGSSATYYSWGSVELVWQDDDTYAYASADTTTNYSAPLTITTQSYNVSASYSPWLGITQTTGSNGETLTMTYDSYGRPATATSPYGSVTTYSYSPASSGPPFTQTKTGPDGYTLTTLDGFGRAVKVQRGTSATNIVSEVDTVYAPCACSPLGKVQQVSQPYAPGSGAYWTAYTYDGLGRALSVQQPDGESTTTYAYAGSQTTVTDPAGNWKQLTTDALGNLLTVAEPDPCVTGNTFTTSYTYDWMKHVIGVTMTRPSVSYASNGVCSEIGTPVTQNRSFTYNAWGGLASATNPENGTVYYYYANSRLQRKHDAKGQDIVYTWGGPYLDMIQKYPQGQSNAEDTCERVTYGYGTTAPSYDRLTSVQYSSCGVTATEGPVAITEQYSYNAPGGVVSKTLKVTPSIYNSGSVSVTANWAYGGDGRVKSVSYPVTMIDPNWGWFGGCNYGECYGPNVSVPYTLTYGFDGMGRPISLTDNYYTSASSNYTENEYYYPYQWPMNTTTWVQNVSYDAASRMTGLQYLTSLSDNGNGVVSDTYETESMSYNVNGQLSSLNLSGPVTGSLQYGYSATRNNGQIAQVTDTISGETVVYQYDSLKRLISAASTPTSGSSVTPWNETFQLDGFGNLTAKVLNGTANSISVNAATNQLTNAVYDANGNMTSGAGATLAYDVMNRVFSAQEVSGGMEFYGYAPDGKRVVRQLTNGTQQFTFYGLHGEKLGVYEYASDVYVYTNQEGGYALENILTPVQSNIYFGGKMIWSDNAPAYLDRLGTNRALGARFYPYGDEITSTSNDREKFATYTRDSYTGLDYADQRFYASTYGRFNTRDPYQAGGASSGNSSNPGEPGSWNRYAYVGGDPVNRMDPTGMDWVWTGTGWCSTLDYYGGCYDPEGGDSNDCSQLAAMAWMNYGGFEQMCGTYAPIIPVQQSSPPQVTCSLEVESFPLITFGSHGPDLHGSLDFTVDVGSTQVGQDVIEGYTDASGLLQAAVQPGNIGPVGNLAGTGTNDGTITGLQVCGALATLQADVAKINGANITYNRFGPNSNSALRYMLQSLQSLLGSSWYHIPWTLVGYGTKLPGLEGGVVRPPRPPRPVI